MIEAGDDDDDGDDAASRPAEVTTQRHRPNVATEMLPPSRAGDDSLAAAAAPTCLHNRCGVQLPSARSSSLQPPASLQCPSPHKSCSSQECPKPQVLVATEPRRCGDTTMRRRRGGHDKRQSRCRCSPGPLQKLQAPLQPQPRCFPKCSGALTVPAAALSGLAAPLTQEDGLGRRGRRRDDDNATTSTGGQGRRVTISKTHSFGVQSGDGGADGGPLGAVRAKGPGLWTGWSSRR